MLRCVCACVCMCACVCVYICETLHRKLLLTRLITDHFRQRVFPSHQQITAATSRGPNLLPRSHLKPLPGLIDRDQTTHISSNRLKFICRLFPVHRVDCHFPNFQFQQTPLFYSDGATKSRPFLVCPQTSSVNEFLASNHFPWCVRETWQPDLTLQTEISPFARYINYGFTRISCTKQLDEAALTSVGQIWVTRRNSDSSSSNYPCIQFFQLELVRRTVRYRFMYYLLNPKRFSITQTGTHLFHSHLVHQ